MIGKREGYQAFLLRLWRVHSSGKLVWRASLQSPHTGERQAFADLPGLFAYLEQKTSDLDLFEPSKDQPDEE